MSQIYARTNFRIAPDITSDVLSQWQEILYDTAMYSGTSDDIDVFYSEDEHIIGVSILLEDDPMLVLEAGSVFGYISAVVDRSKLKSSQRWFSFNDELGNVIE